MEKVEFNIDLNFIESISDEEAKFLVERCAEIYEIILKMINNQGLSNEDWVEVLNHTTKCLSEKILKDSGVRVNIRTRLNFNEV